MCFQASTTTQIYPSKFFNTDGATPVKHIFVNGVEVATVTGTGSSASVYSVNTDHLTGSNIVTDSGGGVVETEDYIPFGSIRFDEKTGSFSEQRKFAGHEFDVDTSLSYQDARYYDPTTGKWLSEDAFVISPKVDLTDPQQLNAYGYVRNNPINGIDPTGNNIFGYAGGFIQGVANSIASNAYQFLSNLNPFHAQNAYAPATETSYLPQTQISQTNISKDTANGTAAGLDFGDKLGQLIGVGTVFIAPDIAPEEVGALQGDNAYTMAGNHVFNLHPDRYPGLSAQDIAGIAKDTHVNADVSATIEGTHPNTGLPVNKQYYGNTNTKQVFINTNIGSPTVFPNSNPAAYINRQISRDLIKYGVK